MTQPGKHRSSFAHRHSLSLTTAGILSLWTILHLYADPNTHIGSFYGNAIADWSGVLVTVLATKYLYERDQPRVAIRETNRLAESSALCRTTR